MELFFEEIYSYGQFDLLSIPIDEVKSIMYLTDEEFDKLYERSFNSTKRNGDYIFYKKNIYPSEKNPKYFSAVGFYLFLYSVLELKKYKGLDYLLQPAKNKCFESLMFIYKEVLKKQKTKKKIKKSDIAYEDLMSFQIKKIDTSKNHIKLEDVIDNTHKFFNKSVVFTGNFEKFSIRNKLIPLLNSYGCTVKSGVTSKVDFLICGSDGGPSKIKKAGDLSIPIITEEEFYLLIDL